VKKTKKICDEILERFGDGEYLIHICTGKGEYPDQTIGANETFVYNDRIVIVDEDHLCAATASSANVDVIVSYLDQTR